MYCTKIDLYGSRAYPLALGAIYEKVVEYYDLPSIELLLRSLQRDVQWPKGRHGRLEAYCLDNLKEQSETTIFQVRFATAPDARELTALFISIEESQVKNMSFQFPGKSGRLAGSRVIAWIKSTCHDLHIGPRDLEFEIQGFIEEQGQAGYVKEHSISAFVWIEGLGRYLHIRENPRDVQEVRRGKKYL